MRLRRAIRDHTRPLFERIEDKLERSGKQVAAQKFRRLQHDVFGLTEIEWYFLQEYFRNFTLLGYAAQRAWTTSRNSYLNDKLLASSTNPKEAAEYRKTRDVLDAEVLENNELIHVAKVSLFVSKRKLLHTPIFRAFKSHKEEKDDWHMTTWLEDAAHAGVDAAKRTILKFGLGTARRAAAAVGNMLSTETKWEY
ncbi:hypothetical protein ASPCAL05934 [Aspergillus calidoustus]|uniref:Uncharacterized protein n=1 Tax=Aspergillus calidoustus TaxID=454130 RepID=A0A0U5C892_ASPCI|nr:hypothetical protein ASPCAL05934 [Aspergillus calidoustus]